MMNEPEWTAENINRKKGATTFNICGWCKYASSGSCRYNCYLETSCSLLKEYGIGSEVVWNTKCIVKKLGKEDFEVVIHSKKYEIKSCKRQIKDLEEEITTIKKLKSKKKPPLPDNRTTEFKLGSIVYIYHQNKWHKGTVTSGYRTGDGCVSYVLDDYPESRGGEKGPWGCGVSVPCILKEWEYLYFKKNINEFKEWLELCDRTYNGEKLPLKDYLQALNNKKEVNV